MIETSNSAVSYPDPSVAAGAGRKVLRMVTNERMAGSVPSWEKPVTARQKVEQALGSAENGNPVSFEATLAYQQNFETAKAASAEFGFGDLLDMVNPLHHIPVVGHFYRGLTGDEIKPIGRIIGGAVFGGALGAAGSLVNVIVEKETGRDIAGNAMALAFTGETPSFRNIPDRPEQRLENAARIAGGQNPAQGDLPGALLAFADPGQRRDIVIERSSTPANGRTAGTMEHAARTYAAIQKSLSAPPPREPITQLSLRSMPYEIY